MFRAIMRVCCASVLCPDLIICPHASGVCFPLTERTKWTFPSERTFRSEGLFPHVFLRKQTFPAMVRAAAHQIFSWRHAQSTHRSSQSSTHAAAIIILSFAVSLLSLFFSVIRNFILFPPTNIHLLLTTDNKPER